MLVSVCTSAGNKLDQDTSLDGRGHYSAPFSKTLFRVKKHWWLASFIILDFCDYHRPLKFPSAVLDLLWQINGQDTHLQQLFCSIRDTRDKNTNHAPRGFVCYTYTVNLSGSCVTAGAFSLCAALLRVTPDARCSNRRQGLLVWLWRHHSLGSADTLFLLL